MILLQRKTLHIFTFLIALSAMLGSLYLGEVKGLTPCLFCWYQRILMYPIAFVSLVGILIKDRQLPLYILPMSIFGIGVAAYHYAVQMFIPAQNVADCIIGDTSCATIYFKFFGFVTIPFLSLIAFSTITAAMIISKKLRM